MKSFIDYLNSVKKVYEFRLKFANCNCDDEFLSSLKHALAAYDVEEISKPKRLPCDDYAEFAGMGACEVEIVDVKLNYPAIPEQIRQLVVAKTHLVPKQVYVTTKSFDVQDAAAEAYGKDVKGARLGAELEEVPSGQEYVGQKRVESLLKELAKDPSYTPEFAKTEK
ncbi:MAG: hypothetical protein N2235_02415 [Fischerella sp.]|nr:hypothetical protein [Fischerella sp.]